MSGGPKKVAVLLPSMQVGGAERLVLEELSYLKDDPRFVFEVHLVFEKGQFFSELSELGLPVHVWNAPHKSIHMFKIYWDIVMHLRSSGCDVLHCHLLNSVGSLLGVLAGVPTITTVHGDIAFGYWARFGFKRSSLVLGCGEKVARNISSFVKQSKIGVLNNAIRSNKQQYIDRVRFMEKLGVPLNSVMLLSLGRLTTQKGYDILIHAMHQVINKSPEVILLIAGDGEDRQTLFELIAKLSLEKHVKLLGIVQNTHELLEYCNVYVNSSRWEGLPMTLLEAMAHKKPIVATKVGSNRDVIINAKTGLLIEPEDINSLAQAILTLVQDKKLQEEFGSNAKKLFLSEYTIEKHCKKLAEYYMRLNQGGHKD